MRVLIISLTFLPMIGCRSVYQPKKSYDGRNMAVRAINKMIKSICDYKPKDVEKVEITYSGIEYRYPAGFKGRCPTIITVFWDDITKVQLRMQPVSIGDRAKDDLYMYREGKETIHWKVRRNRSREIADAVMTATRTR